MNVLNPCPSKTGHLQVEDSTILAEILDEVRELSASIEKLKFCTVGENRLGPLMNLQSAAQYTGRSRRTFQKEFHQGLWTSVTVGGGHPKFSRSQLDEDMAAWIIFSKFRKYQDRAAA